MMRMRITNKVSVRVWMKKRMRMMVRIRMSMIAICPSAAEASFYG